MVDFGKSDKMRKISGKVDEPKHRQQIYQSYFIYILERLHQNDGFFFWVGVVKFSIGQNR